ncbi:hypothetical protein GOBAR_AA26007 [Gossypium barbadense]|uniref:Uncharacterized protein n=1 Tax=Gossypium barbadense TaxID=3634 RepID=A0A2P5WU82_GOSBA|nr:hypothetical protein GOBAR_AA26007 [Gossypium barbadense]
MGHALPDCGALQPAEKDKIRETPPFSLALKAELNLQGRESFMEESQGMKSRGDGNNMRLQLLAVEKTKKPQVEGVIVDEEDYRQGEIQDEILKSGKKTSWKRFISTRMMDHYSDESIT